MRGRKGHLWVLHKGDRISTCSSISRIRSRQSPLVSPLLRVRSIISSRPGRGIFAEIKYQSAILKKIGKTRYKIIRSRAKYPCNSPAAALFVRATSGESWGDLFTLCANVNTALFNTAIIGLFSIRYNRPRPHENVENYVATRRRRRVSIEYPATTTTEFPARLR